MRNLSLLLLVFVAACSATGNVYSSKNLPAMRSGEAQIVLYRPAAMGGGSHPAFKINGATSCPTLLLNGYQVANVKAGRVSIDHDAFMEGAHFKFDAKAGRRYFIKVTPNTGSNAAQAMAGLVGVLAHDAVTEDAPNHGNYSFHVMDSDTAKYEVSAMRDAGACR